MTTFQGFPDGKVSFTRIPGPFFSELLPQIDHLGELESRTLYAIWQLDRMGGDVRYLQERDFLTDEVFMLGMGSTSQESTGRPERVPGSGCPTWDIAEGQRATRTGNIPRFLKHLSGTGGGRSDPNGDWRHSDDPHIPVELGPERPSIYRLYEQNIGPMTPLLADTLQDAEDTYPAEWIEEAFRIAIEKNVRNWRYVEAILRRWHERGYDGRETRRDTEKSRRQYADWEAD